MEHLLICSVSPLVLRRSTQPSPLVMRPSTQPSPLVLGPSAPPSPLVLRPSTQPSPLVLGPSAPPSPLVLRPSAQPSPLVLRPSTQPSPLVLGPSAPPSPLVLRPSAQPSPLVSGPSAPSPLPSQLPMVTAGPQSLLRLENSSSTSPPPSELTSPPSPSQQTDYEEYLQTQVASVIDILVEVAVEEMARHLEECSTSAIPLQVLQTDDLIRFTQMSKLKRRLIQMNQLKTEQFALFMKELGRESTERMKLLLHTGLVQVSLNASKEILRPEQVTMACDDVTSADTGDLSNPEEEKRQDTPENFAPSDNGHPTTKKMPEWETAEASSLLPPSKQKATSLSEHDNSQEQDPDVQSASHVRPTLSPLYTGDITEQNLAAQTADPLGAESGVKDIVKSTTSGASQKETEHNNGQEQGPDVQSASHVQPTLTLPLVGDVAEDNVSAQPADPGGADPGNDASEKRSYSCALCGEHFDEKSPFLHHSIQHENWYVCLRCGKGFGLKCYLAEHHRLGNCFSCSYCGEFFRTELILKRHLWRHTGLKPHTCLDCGVGYVDGGNLKRHRLSHVTCSYCEKTFQKSALRRHLCVDDELLISCQVCPATFNNDKDMFYHKHSRDPEDQVCLGDPKRPAKRVKVDRHLCEVCGLSFRKPLYFQSHMTAHTGEKLLGCEICGKKYRYHRNVLRHMLHHTDPKKHLCETCGKRFTHAVGLREHQLIHIRRSVCNLCGKKCKTLRTLNRHRRTSHSSVYSVSCEVCGKNFWRKAMLKYHMRLHTGESPHTCTDCGKSFTLKCHMIFHKCLKSVP